MAVEDKRIEAPEVEQKDLRKMNYRQLQDIAKEYNVPGWHLMNEKQLRQAIGVAPEGALVYDRSLGMKDEEMRAIREQQGPIPGKTIYFEKDRAKLDKIWARDPLAFNHVDMTDPYRQVVYHFTRKVECVCGTKFKIQREWYELRREGREVVKVKKTQEKGIVEKYCPKCGKKHIYLDPDVEYDPAKVRLMEQNE